MTGLSALIRRNVKLYFKDKGMFFTSLITPVILLVLYTTFLGNVYRDALVSAMPQMLPIPEKLIDATVGGQLISSLLAVSCVTITFCCNMLMVQDKVTGARRDLDMTPVRPSALALGYYLATLVSSMLVCLIATGVSLLYLAQVGWYMSVSDVLKLLLDALLLVVFGTALSSVVSFFLSTQGQISAVGTVVSSGYGFICGAYMPISNFSAALQKALSFLPGTYGTSLLRNHALAGVFREMEQLGLPEAALTGIRDSIDCNLYFFQNPVSEGCMYIIMLAGIAVLLGVYIALNALKRR